ncbi:ran GTPase-activating protein 1-like [Oncorhynchus keta]|uniref:ran GTPase-activating protein 1-like n=1 Tax=Oncorhynchus keta TaxID=8018 RepID=UPI00227C4CBD|nr:ran GTPase-activating protein 1-like [Oncorhynchus keta]
MDAEDVKNKQETCKMFTGCSGGKSGSQICGRHLTVVETTGDPEKGGYRSKCCTTMGSDDIALVAYALSKTHVGDEELSYEGRGLKMDNTESVKELVQEIEEYQGLCALWL